MKKGFTLIELLITIAIVGVLSAIVVMSASGQQKKARDAQRESDLAQYQVALEAYANANDGTYPGTTDYSMYNVCTSVLLGSYASTCPQDPTPSTRNYAYVPTPQWNNGTAGNTKYAIILIGDLESVTNTSWEVCYNGKSGLVAHNDGENAWTNWQNYCQI